MLTRRSFLSASAASIAAASLAADRPKMNVLMIAIDDLRPDLGCYGSPNIRSPHMDKLASEGTVFTSAYCQQAVCSPSRTSIMTGLRPDTTRVYELQTHFRKTIPNAVTLPQNFKEAGYTTTGLSKIFHGGLDDSRSWSIPHWVPGGPDWNTPENAERNRRLDEELKDLNWHKVAPRQPRDKRGPSWAAREVADTELADGKTATTAIRALQTLKGGPFFLACGFLKPHLPFIAPKKYFDLYPKEKVQPVDYPEPPSGVPDVALHISGELRSYSDIPEQGPISEEKRLELIRAYFASASYTDAQIGRVLDELDRLGLRDNTIVVLWGDHGWHLGDHGLWNKHTNFERAVRSTLIVRAPGQKRKGTKSAALTEFVDIYPTICDLAGVRAPATLEGTSFAPLLNDPGRRWKSGAFSQYPRQVKDVGPVMGYSIRTDRYRYTEWVPRNGGGSYKEMELYDYKTDPKETANLAAKNPAIVKDLSARLAAGWRAARPS